MSRWIHLNMPTYASIVCDREWVWCKGMTHGQTNLTGVRDTELRAKHILLKHTAYSLKLPHVIWGVRASAQTGPPVSSRDYFHILSGGASVSCSESCGVWWDCQRWVKPKHRQIIWRSTDGFVEIGNARDRTDKLLVLPLARSRRRDLSRSPFHGKSLAWRTIRRFPWSQLVAVAIAMSPTTQLSNSVAEDIKGTMFKNVQKQLFITGFQFLWMKGVCQHRWGVQWHKMK